MEDDQKQRPESLLPYEKWIEQALRHVVAQAIEHVAVEGLPGGHHFYITVRTGHPGVELPQRVKAQYPQEMTIVLQHQFGGLSVDESARTVSVRLSFGGVPSSLLIPFDAVSAFADPEVQVGLRFGVVVPEKVEAQADVVRLAPPAAPQEDAPPAAAESAAPQVVSLDAFRKRPKD
jgi:hypothetical protein